jgi:large subunit ribosomal protein L1
MAKVGKRFKAASTNVNRDARYDVESGMKLVVDGATAKFDETIDVAINLGIDPKQSDQQVRGAVSLPNGLGKTVRVVVFAKGPKEQEAKDAGADYVGADDLVEKINGGWMDFDKAIATPDMMGTVAKVAKVLGPRGLMPNPKVGTVTLEVGKAISAEKKGKCDYRIDKAGIVHAPIGKKSMGAKALKENFDALMAAIVKAKPATSKGNFLKGITVSSTMGPGVKLDVNKVIASDKEA